MLKLNYELTEQKTIELLDVMKIQPDWNILDVGAGTGLLTPEFLKRISGNGSLTLLEPMESFGAMLGKFVADNPGKVLLKQSKIEDSNYECEKDPNGYDAIFIRLVLHHTDATEALEKLMPFLKPGGLFVIQEFVHGTCGFYGSGGLCENLAFLEVNSARAIGEHCVGKDNIMKYIPPPMYKKMLSTTCEILHYDSFHFEDHPKSTLGDICFKMITKHCDDEELVKKGTQEYDRVCQEPDSVVYSRTHLHIIGRKL